MWLACWNVRKANLHSEGWLWPIRLAVSIAAPRLVERLTITIDVMESLAPRTLIPIMDWLACLPYPWCSPQIALASAPPLDALEPIRHYVARGSA